MEQWKLHHQLRVCLAGCTAGSALRGEGQGGSVSEQWKLHHQLRVCLDVLQALHCEVRDREGL